MGHQGDQYMKNSYLFLYLVSCGYIYLFFSLVQYLILLFLHFVSLYSDMMACLVTLGITFWPSFHLLFLAYTLCFIWDDHHIHSFNLFMKVLLTPFENAFVLCLVVESCPTLCDPMDCSPPGSSVHGDSPGKNTGVGCHALLQGIFPTQELTPGLPHCRRILYHLSHQGKWL